MKKLLLYILSVSSCINYASGQQGAEPIGYPVDYYDTVKFRQPFVLQNGDTCYFAVHNDTIYMKCNSFDSVALGVGDADLSNYYTKTEIDNQLLTMPKDSVRIYDSIAALRGDIGSGGGAMTADAINDSSKISSTWDDTLRFDRDDRFYDTTIVSSDITPIVVNNPTNGNSESVIFQGDSVHDVIFTGIGQMGLAWDNTKVNNTIFTYIFNKTYYNIIEQNAIPINDVTPPIFSQVTVLSITDTTAEFTGMLNEDGTVLFGAWDSTYTQRDTATIRAGTDSRDYGTIDVTGNVTFRDTIINLKVDSFYSVHYFAYDDYENGTAGSKTDPFESTTTAIPTGYVAAYLMNNDWTDETGDNNGTNQGGATFWFDRFGNDSSAGNFTGNVKIDCGNNTVNLSGTDYTISCWVKWETAGDGIIVGKDTTGFRQYYISNSSGGSVVSAAFDAGGTLEYSTYGSGVTLNKWTHLVGVFRSGDMELYKDTVDVGTLTAGITTVGQKATDMYIGNKGNGTNYFDGIIDDVIIYDKALSKAEITQLYTNGGKITTTAYLDTYFQNLYNWFNADPSGRITANFTVNFSGSPYGSPTNGASNTYITQLESLFTGQGYTFSATVN